MRQAELAAELLDLDPTCIYTAERFNEELIRRFSEEDSHQPRRDGTGAAPGA